MKPLLNTLYITTDGSYLHKERETLVVEQDREKVYQCPIHTLDSILCFGRVMVSPDLMAFCGERNVGLTFFTSYGKFQSRIQGPQTGNVLLRRAQYRLADQNPAELAKLMVAAKIGNSRQILMKHQRNHGDHADMSRAIQQLAGCIRRLEHQDNLDTIRGIEGDAAARYFAVFNHLIQPARQPDFTFKNRTRRPPLDPTNALLSFAYSLLTHHIASALQGVGLDAYVGYLHRDRPGRVGLALDMLEELRAWWCDRFVLSLINRQQIQAKDFIQEASGAVRLQDDARKKLLSLWQDRKQDTLQHPYLQETIPVGLIPHVQASLLAKHLRGDLDHYPPFVTK